ncbi:MAG: ferrous iron transport protein B [Nitrososphaerales archaeon]
MLSSKAQQRHLTIALVGNANVGKSAIFNQLTGLNQVVSNWPGKTVERAEGVLHFQNYIIKVVDLPGIYSLSTYSIEELVTRDYLVEENLDVVVNVIDASALERNLYLTLQLLELGLPLVIALNQVDFAAKKGLRLDVQKLSDLLAVPVVPTIAVTGSGINELLEVSVKAAKEGMNKVSSAIKYGKEVEEQLNKLSSVLKEKAPNLTSKYPARWLAIKLLEKDPVVIELVKREKMGQQIQVLAEAIIEHLEKIHGESSIFVIASERYSVASKIAGEVVKVASPPKLSIEEKLSDVTARGIIGYLILVAIFTGTFATIFYIGGFLVTQLEFIFGELLLPMVNSLLSFASPILTTIIVDGILGGVIAGLTVVLPYIVPFYLILAILQDSGYLPRAAFLMDNFMHKIGLHGKAFIPLLLGYGCSVPACISCRIMETDRERFLAAFVTVLIPCAARTVIILGLVGRYLGLPAAISIYVFNLIIVFLLGRIAHRTFPGESVGLVMEMPPYRKPLLKVVLAQTWSRTKDFIQIAFPIIIGGSILLQSMNMSGLLQKAEEVLEPFTNLWLGLPNFSIIPLVFGVLRKELALILLGDVAGTFDFSLVLSPVQMVVFTVVSLIYIPCISTIAALIHEFGVKRTLLIVFLNITLAFIIGGVTYRILTPLL